MSAPLPKPRHLAHCTCGEMLEIWDLSDHLCVCGRQYSSDGALLPLTNYIKKEKPNGQPPK